MRRRTLKTLPLILACLLALASCGGDGGGAGSTAGGGFPLTVENCGSEVTIEEPPQRVVVIRKEHVPLLEAVGALDKVVAKVGYFPPELYAEPTRAALENIPTIGGDETSSAEVEVSLEAVLAQNPDLVINPAPESSGVNRESLAQSGIPLIASFVTDCPNPPPVYENPSFDAVYEQVEFYGQIFDRQDEAAAVVASLQKRVAEVREAAAEGGAPRTAAAVFVPVGGGQAFAYGTKSMGDAQMEIVGLTNVFGDVDERAIEVSSEEILEQDPDVLIILTIEDLEAGQDAFLSLPGAQSLKAVRNDEILVMKFDYMDPPTPFSVEGLEKVAQAFGSQQ